MNLRCTYSWAATSCVLPVRPGWRGKGCGFLVVNFCLIPLRRATLGARGWNLARRTKEQAEQTREAILDAAEQVFFQRGVSRASLEEIGRVAGVTRGAVYWHFKDKLDLFLAIEERVRLPQEQMLAQLARSAPVMRWLPWRLAL